MNRDQPGGTGGLYVERGAGQPEFVGGTGRQVVLVVGHHRGKAFHPANAYLILDRGPVMQDVVEQIGLQIAGAGKYTDIGAVAARVYAGLFERRPGGLQPQPLLRVDQRGFARGDAEKRGVEIFDIVEYAAGGNEAGLGEQRVDIGLVGTQRIGVEMGDGFDPGHQVRPEGVGIARAGETPGHTHDRDSPIPCCHGRIVDRRLRCDRGHAGGRVGEAFGQLANGGVLEQLRDRRCLAVGLGDATTSDHQRKRIAADIEETVVNAGARHAGDLGPDFGERLFDIVTRRDIAAGTGRIHREIRHRQAAPVHLAVRGQWKRLHRHIHVWAHHRRQARAHVRTQGIFIEVRFQA